MTVIRNMLQPADTLWCVQRLVKHVGLKRFGLMIRIQQTSCECLCCRVDQEELILQISTRTGWRSSSAASRLITLKTKRWNSWWKQLKSSVCVPRRPPGLRPAALIWLPAGGWPALKSLPSFSIVERNICSLEGRGEEICWLLEMRSLIWFGEGAS